MKREIKKVVQTQSGTLRVTKVEIKPVEYSDKDNPKSKKKEVRDKLVLTGYILEEAEKTGEDKAREISISGTTQGGMWLPTANGEIADEENPSVTTASSVGKLMTIAQIKDYDDETYVEFEGKDLPVIRDASGKYLIFNVTGIKG